MRDIDELQLYRGNDYVLPNGVKIRCPTLGEICDYGESDYLAMISMFTATTMDRCAQLEDMGIDYTTISNFEMFWIFIPLLNVKTTSILFGDFDFTLLKPISKDNRFVLINKDGDMFDEDIFDEMSAYIRKMNGIPPPKYTKVANDFAKKQMIIDARNDAEFQRRLRLFKGKHSEYQPYISSLVNHAGFKYGWKEVWDMKIYAFFDSLKRISIISNAEHLYTGLYSGCIDFSKIKKDLDWIRPID